MTTQTKFTPGPWTAYPQRGSGEGDAQANAQGLDGRDVGPRCASHRAGGASPSDEARAEIAAEERGEDIAAEIIERTIRALLPPEETP